MQIFRLRVRESNSNRAITIYAIGNTTPNFFNIAATDVDEIVACRSASQTSDLVYSYTKLAELL